MMYCDDVWAFLGCRVFTAAFLVFVADVEAKMLETFLDFLNYLLAQTPDSEEFFPRHPGKIAECPHSMVPEWIDYPRWEFKVNDRE